MNHATQNCFNLGEIHKKGDTNWKKYLPIEFITSIRNHNKLLGFLFCFIGESYIAAILLERVTYFLRLLTYAAFVFIYSAQWISIWIECVYGSFSHSWTNRQKTTKPILATNWKSTLGQWSLNKIPTFHPRKLYGVRLYILTSKFECLYANDKDVGQRL